jgi:hypothetical protein
MVEILKAQVHLSDDNRWVHLALMINELERALNRSEDQTSMFEKLLRLLETSFDERTPQRMEHLGKITFWTDCERQFQFAANPRICPLMRCTSFPVQRRLLQ